MTDVGNRTSLLSPPSALTEKQWDHQLFNSKDGLATTLGWNLVYHTLRSKGSRAGFPDRILVRERLIAVELKTDKGKPTPDQIEWLNGLANAGVETYLWRPSDLDEAAKVLAGRWTYMPRERALMAPWSNGIGRDTWTPASLWRPSGDR